MELLEAIKSLQQTLETKTKHLLFIKKKIYYEAGDKSGSLLARALWEPNTSIHIMGIRRPDGLLDVTTEAIATHFHSYYSKLYNLSPQHRPPEVQGDRAQAIQKYLTESVLPK